MYKIEIDVNDNSIYLLTKEKYIGGKTIRASIEVDESIRDEISKIIEILDDSLHLIIRKL